MRRREASDTDPTITVDLSDAAESGNMSVSTQCAGRAPERAARRWFRWPVPPLLGAWLAGYLLPESRSSSRRPPICRCRCRPLALWENVLRLHGALGGLHHPQQLVSEAVADASADRPPPGYGEDQYAGRKSGVRR
ncbi:hypothetical protein [Actinoplanes sp. NPDC051411]|jgi:hypothetical protein|uniref:hypothetical protein n=1 Tax=Actinoplanes sp. NPDC051411 TaxID=3155522 RepID=UPI0034452106